MFVSVVLDPGGIESSKSLVFVLTQFGFKKVQRACWESGEITENQLQSLKKEIDKVTDYYDSVRLYQFPVDNMMAITSLSHKKWRRSLLRAPHM